MQSSFSRINQFTLFPDTLTRFAYQGFKQSKSFFSFVHKAISHPLTNIFVSETKTVTQLISTQILLEIQQRQNQLAETDRQDARKGVYPVEILFDNPWQDFCRYYPDIWIDLGYLSSMQVEILFNGVADSMRRRILAPLKQGLSIFASVPPDQIKVLDVACGTGQTLKFIRATLPKASLFGVDSDLAYLRKANQLLSENPGESPQFTYANAEELPYPDNYFHGISSVFLFHKLSATARQRVIEECFRVTKPGGVLTICDSMQLFDFPEFEVLMENYFPTIFHQPYYRDYIKDNLVEHLEKAGFEKVETESHFFSKYWIAHKPEIISY